MTQVKPKSSSLIERAAEVYDFGAAMRARRPIPQDAIDAPQPGAVVSEPAPAPHPIALPETSPSPEPAPVAAPVRAARPVEPAPPTMSPALLATLAAAQASQAEVSEWFAAPSDVAQIDRIMLAEKGMLVPGAPVGALAEEYRLIKRQLLITARQVAETARPRTILVGSGKPGEGKTYSAINLALSLAAERDIEVLLVDGDFAKPDVMATLGLEDSIGLLDILGDDGLDPESCIVATDVPQFKLLPAGKRTHADTELLASDRTGQVIDRLLAANPRRMIVFDTPPALAASPASVLALLVGQVMLVVRADRTTESDVRDAVALLDGCEHISLVLNAVSYQPGDGRFGSYYGQEK